MGGTPFVASPGGRCKGRARLRGPEATDHRRRMVCPAYKTTAAHAPSATPGTSEASPRAGAGNSGDRNAPSDRAEDRYPYCHQERRSMGRMFGGPRGRCPLDDQEPNQENDCAENRLEGQIRRQVSARPEHPRCEAREPRHPLDIHCEQKGIRGAPACGRNGPGALHANLPPRHRCARHPAAPEPLRWATTLPSKRNNGRGTASL